MAGNIAETRRPDAGVERKSVQAARALMWLAVVAQVLTVVITWPLWQTSRLTPALPRWEWLDWQIPCGWLMIVTAVLCGWWPRGGVWVHGLVYLMACGIDQMRTQPQFAALWVLMLAISAPQYHFLGRWFLISMWLWAGIHKLTSPEWLGPTSYQLLERSPLSPDFWHGPFVYGAAGGEIALAIAAVLWPRWGAIGCLMLHFGIVLFLSPLGIQWNYSVIPWNSVTALGGAWLLWNQTERIPRGWLARTFVGGLLIYPLGFYWGLVDHGIGFVLYSENFPKGLITTRQGVREITGWGELCVPFPNERRLLLQHFTRTSQPGDKLHIYDPRPALPDQWFRIDQNGSLLEISETEFLSGATPPVVSNDKPVIGTEITTAEIRGVAFDPPLAVWQLRRAGVRMLKRAAADMIYAVEIRPDQYAPQLLAAVIQLRNLEQLQLSSTAITDGQLNTLAGHPRLQGLGINQTELGDDCLATLASLPSLQDVQFEQTLLTRERVWEILDRQAIEALQR